VRDGRVLVEGQVTPRRVWPLLAAAASALRAATLGAQAVRVRVVERATSAPVAGAIVSLLTGDSVRVSPGLTDADGRQELRASGPGTYRVQVERVGYATVVTLPVELGPGATRDLPVLLTSRATSVAGVRVVGRRQCAEDPARTAETANLWAEARKALESSELAAAGRLVPVEARRYRRSLDRVLRVTQESVTTRTASTGRPYVTLAPEELAARGFVRRDDVAGDVYFAPDARVLLSDAFLRGHCFAVEEQRAESDARLVGLAFRPVRSRGDLVDVAGTLWLDARSAELRYLEYRYTGLGAGRDAPGVGGRVEFDRLPTGAWIVRRWYIRTPQRAQTIRPETGMREVAVVGYTEDGGEVVVRAGGGAPGGAPGAASRAAALVGAVYDSTRGAGVAGARVLIAGPDGRTFTDSTDADGRFRRVVEPGRYTVRVDHPLFAHPAARGELTAETTAGDSVSLLAFVPAAATLTAACGPARPARPDAPTGTVVGRVRDASTAAPLAFAQVAVRWTAPRPIAAGPRVRVGPRGYEMRVSADAAGRYVACGVPAGVPLSIAAGPPDADAASARLEVPPNGIAGRDVAARGRP
jgi:hypothetical protein